MSEVPSPAWAYAEILIDLAEGRTEPDAWLAWWKSHSSELEAVLLRGWFLKLKPMMLDSGINRATWISQQGACYILQSLKIPCTPSNRYQLAWEADFERRSQEQAARRAKKIQILLPRISRLAEPFPKFAKFLQKRVEHLDRLDEPATELQLAVLESSLGMPLPDLLRRFLQCTAELQLEGLALGLGSIQPHPVLSPTENAPTICIAEYWLKGDGDQVLIERTAQPHPDPPVFYYDHSAKTNTAEPLADSFSAWMESLPKSRLFRR